MARRRRPTLAAIRDNPTLHPRAFALVQERLAAPDSRRPGFKWHLHADSPDSSQAFALSAFLPLLELPDKNQILEAFVTQALPPIPRRAGRSWDVLPEYASPRLLWDSGKGEPTAIDTLLLAADAVVCVESKFRVDAGQGWGKCSQPPRFCRGFHGPGSDWKGTATSCRLEVADGDRGPRLYWDIARRYFREEALVEQTPPAVCPFWKDYQLMRNFLFAARYSEEAGLPHFGAIGIVPAARAAPLAAGVERFKRELLLPAAAEHLAVAHYEDHVALLGSASTAARELAVFLGSLLDSGP